ncbi:class A beta-lactamase, subclass A2 [Kaistella jeonii]|uniref:beta-lactamase n=1 Tax=Kaistella jeonii TaxID=266749 RepID=A0A0C1FRY6_9FLAO|nr:class A beta-lactamase, subclass A2 [Kaistella jeonii]KIA90664.1 beta-lactamase [Kaistella jeonii]SFB69379.1 beta-lactamase class A [Kaistella jeonii]VEI94732.1 Extended-spectrum beta-lactamase PER-1 precursor [Kaistella jeonii]
MKKTISLFLFISIFSFAQKQNLKKEIFDITKNKNATVAVSINSFENQFNLNINGDKKLPMLSVFKFHIALAVLNKVDEGKLSLNQNIFIKKSELLEKTWSPIREKYPEGNIEMPLSELIKYTVAQSDNNGCDILLRLIGGTKTVQKFINSKGIKNFQIKANEEEMHQSYKAMYENFTTTNSANDLLKKFYNDKIVSKNSTNFLMKIMIETTTGTNKIVAQLPKGTQVAHKTGSSGKNDNGLTIAENDIAIITLPNGKHYAISIFVSDSMESAETNTKMIADISKIVFDYFSKK